MRTPSSSIVKFRSLALENGAGQDAIADISHDIEEYPIEVYHDNGESYYTTVAVLDHRGL